MKINSKILSIPPFISTSWKNIASLHVQSNRPLELTLVVTLHSGVHIDVPGLDRPMIEAIFAAHANFLEQEEKLIQSNTPPQTSVNQSGGQPQSSPNTHGQMLSVELPFKNGMTGMEQFGSMIQHNPEQADSPDIPSDILHKITQISKTMGIEDPNSAPKPEPHCNCTYCQIARAIQTGFTPEIAAKEEPEEIVSNDELTFRTWDIAQNGKNLYVVTNPLDDKEHYNVFLGDPIGCTCGDTHCEHIRAVLNS